MFTLPKFCAISRPDSCILDGNLRQPSALCCPPLPPLMPILQSPSSQRPLLALSVPPHLVSAARSPVEMAAARTVGLAAPRAAAPLPQRTGPSPSPGCHREKPAHGTAAPARPGRHWSHTTPCSQHRTGHLKTRAE